MQREIHIIGLGIAQPAKLSSQVLAVIAQADIVLGSERQLTLIETHTERQCLLPKLDALTELIESYQSVVVLASGDPLYYGIGKWFSRNFDSAELHFYPALSSIQAICHELQLSQQDVEVVSLHGRPIEKIRRCLKANRYFVILTDKNSSPQKLAKACIAAGFNESLIWVGENMGSNTQQVQQFSADELQHSPIDFDLFHVTVIQALGPGGVLPEFPGIADRHFVTDGESGQGLLTKREIRLNILSLLQPTADDIAWDIGAGCGGVSIEWAYWNSRGRVYAVEHHVERLDCLRQNRDRFGVVENLNVIAGFAPAVLVDLPAPNKVFIGGSGGKLDEILSLVWSCLAEGGTLVASAVTEDSKQTLLQFVGRQSATVTESVQISVSKQGELAGQTLYRPQLPVTLFKFTKIAQ